MTLSKTGVSACTFRRFRRHKWLSGGRGRVGLVAGWALGVLIAAPGARSDGPQYDVDRGFRVGQSGLHVGAYSTAEFANLEDQPANLLAEGINFLVLFEPLPWARIFTESEIGDLLFWEFDSGTIESNPKFDVDRLYVELSANDRLNLRVGKFLAPIGRWNQIAADPFVWTTSEPVLVARTFDDKHEGAMVFGTAHTFSRSWKYSLFGQFGEPIDPEVDTMPADRALGGRLELTSAFEDWSAALSFVSSERDDQRFHLAGLDGLWRTRRTEVSAEWVVSNGSYAERVPWSFFVQGVYDLTRDLHLVTRYELYESAASDEANSGFDLGLAWNPARHLFLKADFLLAPSRADEFERGFIASLAVLF